MLEQIRVCARCEKVFCKCKVGTYSAKYAYDNWFYFLRSRLRIRGL